MKKILFLLAIVLFANAIYAANGFYLGINSGINNVTLTKADPLWSVYGSKSDKISTVSARYSPTVGFQFGYQIHPKFGIQSGISFLRLGHHYQDSTFSKGLLDVVYISDYIHIPLLLRFCTGHDGSGFYLEGGPHINLLQSATLRETSVLETTEQDIKPFIKSKDIGFTVGLGISFQATSNIGLRFGFKGIYSLQDINNFKQVGYDAPKVLNSSLGLNIGANYHF